MSYRIGIEPYHDSEMEYSSEDVVFEFERVGAGFGDTTLQVKLQIPQRADYRMYPREITLRGDGLRALYDGLKHLFDPSFDEID
jgi:hypothetical protein